MTSRNYNQTITLALTFFALFGSVQYVYAHFGSEDRDAGNIIFQLVSGAVYLYAFISILNTRDNLNFLKYTIPAAAPLFGLLVICVLSFFWSADAAATIRRSLALVLSTIFCFYVVLICSYRNFIEALLLTFALTMLTAILFSFLPGIGTDPSNFQYPNAWRGLTGHKTDLGMISGLSLVFFFYALREKIQYKKTAVLFLAFSLLVLVKSQATTPLIIAVLVCAIQPILSFVLPRYYSPAESYKKYILMGMIFSFAVAAFLMVNVAGTAFFDFIGKEENLTGRSTIWDYAFDIAGGQNFIGYGYRAFWVDAVTFDFLSLNPFWGDKIPNNGHSGYFDIYFELGYLGVLVYMVFVLHYFKLCLDDGKNSGGLFKLAALIFYLVYSITEQTSLQQSDFLWMLLTINYFYMARSAGRSI